jgi:ArsR family transcriptional regulator
MAPRTDFPNDIFKNVNISIWCRLLMSVVTVEDRVRRLVDSGLRGSCRPSERISQLKRRAKQPDDMTLRRLEAVFSGLADNTRLRILQLLAKEELCGCEVMAALDLTQPTASHHLGILERSGLISSRREGKWVFYRVADAKVEILLAKGSQLIEGSF